ncbi:hypothetical protein GCM10010330_51270 [Streptomyces tendae]|nr:hypothetical protein GCM10010330_51270 [Streptomyces tendae]
MRTREPQRVEQVDEVVGEDGGRVGDRRVHGDPGVALVVRDGPDPRAESRPERGELGAVALTTVDEYERHTVAAVEDPDVEFARSYGLLLMLGHH